MKPSGTLVGLEGVTDFRAVESVQIVKVVQSPRPVQTVQIVFEKRDRSQNTEASTKAEIGDQQGPEPQSPPEAGKPATDTAGKPQKEGFGSPFNTYPHPKGYPQ